LKTLHKYLYAGGDPVNRVDPSGRGIVEEAFMWSYWTVKTTCFAMNLTTILWELGMFDQTGHFVDPGTMGIPWKAALVCTVLAP
jgi:hypothetical protein